MSAPTKTAESYVARDRHAALPVLASGFVIALACCLCAGLTATSKAVEVDPTDRVRLTVWLYDVRFTDNMDSDFLFWENKGDMYYASWARMEGTPADEAQTNTSDKEQGVSDDTSHGVNKIIFEGEMNCPIPDLEIVIYFWDDDDNTLEKIGKIAKALGEAVGGGVGSALEAIGEALEAAGEPTREELGTLREFDLRPPSEDCPLSDKVTSTHDVKLNQGAGEVNGTVTLSWKAPKIGTCTDVVDPEGDSESADDSDDLEHSEAAQDSANALQLSARVYGEGLEEVMPALDTRTFEFGIDADNDRATGDQAGTFRGMEWRIQLVQSSDGSQLFTAVGVLHWEALDWWPTAIEPRDWFVGRNSVRVEMRHSDLGFPVECSAMAALYRNGLLVDVAPNDPDEIHRLDWLVDEVSPVVMYHRALPTEIAGAVEHIIVKFSEEIIFNPALVHIIPPVPVAYDLEVNTLTITPLVELEPGWYTLMILGGMSDVAGNLLDGDHDGFGGDPFEMTWFVPDRSFLPRNAAGETQNIFAVGEEIYVAGSGFPPAAPFDVFLIFDGSEEEGQALMDLTVGGPTPAQAQPDGTLELLGITWPGEVPRDAEYSIVADMNRDGHYQSGLDRLCHEVGIAVVVEGSCTEIADCADLDGNSIRDDVCLWYDCEAGNCIEIPRNTQADMGSPDGSPDICAPDGVCDSSDRFHALNCFSNIDFDGTPLAYPCEAFPPAASNVDAGQLESCELDGVCDANDAIHAVTLCFQNRSWTGELGYPCDCFAPAPSKTATIPEGQRQATGITLLGPRAARPGEVIDVHVHVDDELDALMAYQLHASVVGGQRGALELVDISVDAARRDWAFAAAPGIWKALNQGSGQMVAGMDAGAGVPTAAGRYLATFSYRVSETASGSFSVSLNYSHRGADPAARTFIFGPWGQVIDVSAITPARIDIQPRRIRSLRQGS